MYRRLESSLPPDFVLPNNFEGLGYFVNDQDQIRMISDPKQPFHYRASKNERFIEVQKEAMNEAIRRTVFERLEQLGVLPGRIPVGTKEGEPAVPIYASSNIESAERVVVYFGESHQDPCIFAGRIVSKESINVGSVVNFAQDILGSPLPRSQPPSPLPLSGSGPEHSSSAASHFSPPKTSVDSPAAQDTSPSQPAPSPPVSKVGLCLANPGQLIWWRRAHQAVTYATWSAQPRQYAVSEVPALTPRNKIPRNETAAAHVACVFADFLRPLVAAGIRLDIVAAGDALEPVLAVLDADWDRWREGIDAVVVAAGWLACPEICDARLAAFWGRRARVYLTSDQPRGTPMAGRATFGCNVYSSGVPDFVESIVPRAYPDFLRYFELVHEQPSYANVPQLVEQEQPDEAAGGGSWDGEEAGETIDVEV